ncbi:MarR family winged helix-turn-helix transcriptional regulator [Janibacter sp. G56]|uniref:MarR family winged helix-turn-helix transcriptional regulator n=1 Tax=Janibacter sp. G56 TaxID=3418717 RepID=UPI003CFD4A43
MTDDGSHATDAPRAEGMGSSLARAVKLLQAARHHAAPLIPGLDPAAWPVVFSIEPDDMRVSEIADWIHSDISTVSRHVTALAGHGIVAKIPDPRDGRAQLVHLTDTGRALVTDLRRQRDQWFGEFLADWSDDDLAAFRAHLDHFSVSLEAELARQRALRTGS